MYATIEDLAGRIAWNDLAERSAPDDPEVRGEALRSYVLATPTPAATEENAPVRRAVAVIDARLADAAAEIRGYLTGRYGLPEQSPLYTDDVAATLRTRTVDIAAYRLFGGETDTERYQVWRRAIEWLESIAAGRVDLFAPQPDVDARFVSRASQFGRDAIAGL